MDGCRVTVYQHLDASVTIGYGPQQLGKYTADGVPLAAKVVEMPLPRKTTKRVVSLTSLEKPRQKRRAFPTFPQLLLRLVYKIMKLRKKPKTGHLMC